MRKVLIFVFLITTGILYSQNAQELKENQFNDKQKSSGSNSEEYAVNDSISLNTPAIFTITFHETKKSLFHLNENVTYNRVYLDYITQDYLMVRQKAPDAKKTGAISKIRRIYLKDIKELGYETGTQESFSAMLGAGVGFLGGAIIGIVARSYDKAARDPEFDSSNTTRSITTPILIGIGTGAILGYLIGGSENEYERFDLSIYNDNKRKFQEINTIVKKGLIHSTKK